MLKSFLFFSSILCLFSCNFVNDKVDDAQKVGNKLSGVESLNNENERLRKAAEIQELEIAVSNCRKEIGEWQTKLQYAENGIQAADRMRARAEEFVFLRSEDKKQKELDNIDNKRQIYVDEKAEIEAHIQSLNRKIGEGESRIAALK